MDTVIERADCSQRCTRRETYERALGVYQETSREAWNSVADCLGEVDSKIVRAIGKNGGLTCDEVEILTGMKHQTVSAQIRHMVEHNLLVQTGKKRETRSGRSAIVWRLP